MIRYKFDELMKKMKKREGATYRKVAAEIEVDLSTLIRLAAAKSLEDYNLCARTLNKICERFNCKISDVMEYTKK